MQEEVAIPQVMPQLIAWAAAAHGERAALVEGELTLDFIALAARCREASRALVAAGIRHGDRIAIWAPNRHEWILAAVGAQSIGAVLVPLNTRMKGAEAAYILQRSGARLLFTVSEFAGNHYPEMLESRHSSASCCSVRRVVLTQAGMISSRGEARWPTRRSSDWQRA